MLLGDLLSPQPQFYLNVIKSWQNPITSSSAKSSFRSPLRSTVFCPEGLQCKVHFSSWEWVAFQLQVAVTHSSSISEPSGRLKPAQTHTTVFHSDAAEQNTDNKDFSQPRIPGFSWQRKGDFEAPIYLNYGLYYFFFHLIVQIKDFSLPQFGGVFEKRAILHTWALGQCIICRVKR